MLQALLKERFQLRVHTESKPRPVQALTVAKNGPKLRESKAEAAGMSKLPGGGLRLQFRRTTLAELDAFLSTLAAVEVPVRDQSGLTAAYDFDWICTRSRD